MGIDVLTNWHWLRIGATGGLVALFAAFCAVVAWLQPASRRRPPPPSAPRTHSLRKVEHA